MLGQKAGAEKELASSGAVRRLRRLAGSILASALLMALPLQAFGDCKPNRPRPKVIIDSMGPCAFDPERMQFAGDPVEQASCLLRPVAKWAKLGPVLPDLPEVLARRVGRAIDLPPRDALHRYLSRHDGADDFAAHLQRPIARGLDNSPDMPTARYLVIHDTSGPFLHGDRWPADIDTNAKINNLAGHRCADGWESAHVIINRSGAMLLGHDFAVPWRATKFEAALQFGTLLKGLFLHVEMIQPRRAAYRWVRVKRKGRTRTVRRGRRNDTLAPVPGFSRPQYESLALVYTVASVRAGRWLIPAFHAVLDNHIRGGHDDPQNFDLDTFAASLTRVLDELRPPQHSLAPAAPGRHDTVTERSPAAGVGSTHPQPEPAMNPRTDKHRNEAVEANEAMNREFNDRANTPSERRRTSRARDADEIKGKAAAKANATARVDKPFPSR